MNSAPHDIVVVEEGQPQQNNIDEVEEDWEEWDGKSPFWIHCVAGSLAGVVEHTAVYPLDTVRTHIQVCASCVHRGQATAAAATSSSSSVYTTTPSSAAASASHHPSLRGLVTATTAAQHPTHTLPTGFWQTMRFLVNEPVALGGVATRSALDASAASTSKTNTVLAEVAGWTRLWRGVQAILIGCIPAHALYFSSYEMVKAACATTPTLSSTESTGTPTNHTATTTTTTTTWWGSSLAGAAAVMSHDMVMTPLDTIKQRMQLGHYSSAYTAIREIVRREGFAALYRSFPITLVSNLPYGMVMVTTHETCKQTIPLVFLSWMSQRSQFHQDNNHNNKSNLEWALTRSTSWQTVLMASSVAGFTASAVTTPLDRIKTALQTQTMAPACLVNPACPTRRGRVLKHVNWQQATKVIYQTEGWRGFCRGFWPRVLSHTPAVAISWTTYETAKQALLQHYHHHPQ